MDYIISYSGESESELEVVDDESKKNAKNKNPGCNTTPGCGGRIMDTNKHPRDSSIRKKEKEEQPPNLHLRKKSTDSRCRSSGSKHHSREAYHHHHSQESYHPQHS